jgi:hypothetical protein
MLADGASFTAVAAAVGCFPDYINRWKQRSDHERLSGLRAKSRGQPPTLRSAALEAAFGPRRGRRRRTRAAIGARASWRR